MLSSSRLIVAVLISGLPLLAQPSPLFLQESGSNLTVASASPLPDAPTPQVEVAVADAHAQTQDSSSSSPSPAPPPAAQETQRQKADEQIKQQEHQRVLGIIPAFNTTYVNDAVSLTAGQKMKLAFRSTTDPFVFAAAFLVAGYHEAMDEDTGFGWGAESYGKRSGAAYLDAFDGNIIGNGILPALLHQDPRYFRLGHGTASHRLLYSIATSFICKHDNTGKWEPNYSNVAGNIISGALSNYYYPSSNSGIGQTIGNGMIVTVEGTFGSVFQEFWPDISRKVLHKDPTNGLDARARAADEAKKKARENQQ